MFFKEEGWVNTKPYRNLYKAPKNENMKSVRQVMIIAALTIKALNDFFEVADQDSGTRAAQSTPQTSSPHILSPEMALMQDI